MNHGFLAKGQAFRRPMARKAQPVEPAACRSYPNLDREATYPQGNNIVFVLFLGYVLFWYLQGGYRIRVLGEMRFEFWLGAILTLAAIFRVCGKGAETKSGVGGWVSALILLMAIMVPLSYVPDISWVVFIDRVVKFGLMGMFIVAFVTNPNRLRWFVAIYLLVGLKLAQEGIHGAMTGSMVWENQGIMRLHGSTPNYMHPNSLGGVMLGFVPFIVYFYRYAPRFVRPVLLAQLGATLIIVVLTGSRAAYVALFVGLWFLIVKSRHRRKAILMAIATIISVAPMLPSQYLERATTIVTQEDKEGGSIGARKQILVDALEIFSDNPFGVGVNAFPAMRADRYGREQDTHNLYLQVATNLGVQGVIVFGGLIISVIALLRRTARDITEQISLLGKLSRDGQKRVAGHVDDLSFMRASCESVCLFLIIRLVLGLFGMDLYEIYWWFAGGVAVAIWRINCTARQFTCRCLGEKTSVDVSGIRKSIPGRNL